MGRKGLKLHARERETLFLWWLFFSGRECKSEVRGQHRHRPDSRENFEKARLERAFHVWGPLRLR